MDAEALLAGLDAEQLAAVTSRSSPLAVLAPAGSGKTRVLTRRIAHRIAVGEVEPQHVLAVTFTRKAATELSDRLRRLGLRDAVTAGTFHSIALSQLRDHALDRRSRLPQVLDRKRRILEEVSGSSRPNRRSLAEVATEIEWAKARQVPPAHYEQRARAAKRKTAVGLPRTAELYRRYEVAKRDRGLFDFDDLLLEAARLIEHDSAFAEAQRWRFRHLFVDEFQDVNPLQFRLLEAWRGDRYDLFVVGDPQQAIYTWNGADPSFLLDIKAHYPPIEIIRLRNNYRSSPQILAGATSVLRTAGLHFDEIAATLGDGDLPVLHAHADERAEATAIARLLRRNAGPGRPWSSMAVLVRTNAQLGIIGEALAAARIPHQVRGTDPVVDHPAIRRLLADLDGDDRPLTLVVEEIEAIGGDETFEDARVELVELARAYASQEARPIGRGFAAWLRANADRRSAGPRSDAVVLATFHAAKGLEWATVHLAGLEAGFVPIAYARTAEARAEEARLLYVAMTRAERELYLHHALRREVRGTPTEREPSPLLVGLPTTEDVPAPTDAVDLLAESRNRLRLAHRPAEDEAARIVDALREWRDRTARRARLAPEAVIPDRVLRAIAAEHPGDVDQLRAVPGLGRIRADRFAEELLDAVRRGTEDAPA